MLRWGLSTSDCYDCGAEQTADHITSGRCPIHRPHEGMHGLIELDVKTWTWLENSALDVLVVCDGTREKKTLELALGEMSIYYSRNHLKCNSAKTQICCFHLRNRDAKRKLDVTWNGL